MIKQIVSLIVIISLCIPLPVIAEEGSGSIEKNSIVAFDDINKENYAYEAICYLYDKGIINGKSEKLFFPDDSLKREEFAKIVVNAFRLSGASKKSFTDAVKGEWYEGYISKAEAAGLMQGVSETEFGIGYNISRQDLAVVIKRLLDNMEVKLNGENIAPFADSETIAPYAKEAVTALCANGIMHPREDNLFLPNEKASRSEAAFAVYSALKQKNEYYASLGRMAPVEQYSGPYDVPTDDHLAELKPELFDPEKLPCQELVYEDFEDGDYGVLRAERFGENAVFDYENGYNSKGCVKVSNDGWGELYFTAEPGQFQPGDWFVFSAMVKGEDISGSGNYRNLVTIYDENGKWITESGTPIKKSTDWTEHKQLIMIKEVPNALTQPENYTIGLSAYIKGLSGTVYYDDFKLSKVVFPPMNTVLMNPNYKGIIKGEGGKSDINLRIYFNDANGYYNLDNFKIVSRIIDKDKNIFLEKTSDIVTSEMDICFSSEKLPMGGDFYLETLLYLKDSGQMLQKQDWPLHKREADFETTVGFDEYGRITKNGVPVFPVASYCGAPYENYVRDFTESGVVDVASHYGMGWYYNWGDDEKTRSYIEKLGEKGIDIALHTGDMKPGSVLGEVSSRVKNFDDVRGLLTKIVNNFKDLPNLYSYYIFDELVPVREGEWISWVNNIINNLDLDHPTNCAINRSYEDRPGSFSRLADFLGYDPYPFTGRESQDLSTVYDTIMVAKATNPNRPVYLIPQGFFFSTRKNSILGDDIAGPSLKEFRNMVFQGLCAGVPMICTYSYNSATKKPSPGRTAEDEWNIHKTLYTEIQNIEPILLSVAPAPFYEIKDGGDWLNTMSRRYDGKSYFFAVNNDGAKHSAKIYLDGISEIKGMYSKKAYTADKNGVFTIDLDTYEVEIFEYEQADYKSPHAELKYFALSECIITDSEGDACFIIPDGMKKVDYKATISDFATLYINGKEVKKSGSIDITRLKELNVKVVSEDGRFSTEKSYKLKRG